DRVDERDLARDELGLVALQPPDVVPADVRAAGQRGDRGPLARELLRVVLAEVGRAGRRGLEHGARRVPLADGDDRDVTGVAPGALARGVDARTDLTPALGDRHAGVPAVKRADGAP